MLKFTLFWLQLIIALKFRGCDAEEGDLESGYELSLGSWFPYDPCPTGLFAYAFEIKAKEEETWKVIRDEVGMTGLRLYCKDPEENEDEHKVTSYSLTGDGTWRGKRTCPNAAWLVGFRQRLDKYWGWTHDDTAVNDVDMVCSDETIVYGGGNLRGEWKNWSKCPKGKAICGLQTKVEDVFLNLDKVGLVRALLRCCPLPPHLNHTEHKDFDLKESNNGSASNSSSKGIKSENARNDSDLNSSHNNNGSTNNPQNTKINSSLNHEIDISSYSSYSNTSANNDTKLPVDKVPEFNEDSKFRNDPSVFDPNPDFINSSTSSFINDSLDYNNPFKNAGKHNSSDNSNNISKFDPKSDENYNISQSSHSPSEDKNKTNPNFHDNHENDHVNLEKPSFAGDPVKHNHKNIDSKDLNNSSSQDGFANMGNKFQPNHSFSIEPSPDIKGNDKKLVTNFPRRDGNSEKNSSTIKTDDESEFDESDNVNDGIGNFNYSTSEKEIYEPIKDPKFLIFYNDTPGHRGPDNFDDSDESEPVNINDRHLNEYNKTNLNKNISLTDWLESKFNTTKDRTVNVTLYSENLGNQTIREDSSKNKDSNSSSINNNYFNTSNTNLQAEETTDRVFGIKNLTNYHGTQGPNTGLDTPVLSPTRNTNVQEGKTTVRGFGIKNLTNYHGKQEPNTGLDTPVLSPTKNTNVQEWETNVRPFGIKNLTNYHGEEEHNTGLDTPVLSPTRNTNIQEGETNVRPFGIKNLTNYHGEEEHNTGLDTPVLSPTRNTNIQEGETTVRGFGIKNLTNYHSELEPNTGLDTLVLFPTRNTDVQEGETTIRGFGIKNLTNYHGEQEPNRGLDTPVLSPTRNTNIQEGKTTVRSFGIKNLTNYHGEQEPNTGLDTPVLFPTRNTDVQERETTVRGFGIINVTDYNGELEPNTGLDTPVPSPTRNTNVQEGETNVRHFGIKNVTNYHGEQEHNTWLDTPVLSPTKNTNIQEGETTVRGFGIKNLTNYHGELEPNTGLDTAVLFPTRNNDVQDGETTVRGFGIKNLTNYNGEQEPNRGLDTPVLFPTRNTNVQEGEATVRGFGIKNLTNYHGEQEPNTLLGTPIMGATVNNQTTTANDLELDFPPSSNATKINAVNEVKSKDNISSSFDTSSSNNDSINYNPPNEAKPDLHINTTNIESTPERGFGIENFTNYHDNQEPKTELQVPGIILDSELTTISHTVNYFTNKPAKIPYEDPTINIAETGSNVLRFPNVSSTNNFTQISVLDERTTFDDATGNINFSSKEINKTLPNIYPNIPSQTDLKHTTSIRGFGTKNLPNFLVVQITGTKSNFHAWTFPFRITIPTNKPTVQEFWRPDTPTNANSNKSDERTQNRKIYFPDDIPAYNRTMQNTTTNANYNVSSNSSRDSKLYFPFAFFPPDNGNTIAPNPEEEVNLNRIDLEDSEKSKGYPKKVPSNDSENVGPGSPNGSTTQNPNLTYNDNWYPGIPDIFTVNITDKSVETTSKKGARYPATRNGDIGSNFFNSIILSRAAQEATLVEAQRRSKVFRKHSESHDAMIVMGVLSAATVMAGSIFFFVRYTRKRKQKWRQLKNKAKVEPWEKYVIKLKQVRAVEPARPILSVQPI